MFIVYHFLSTAPAAGYPQSAGALQKPHHQHVQHAGDGELHAAAASRVRKYAALRRRHRSWPKRSSGTGWIPRTTAGKNAAARRRGLHLRVSQVGKNRRTGRTGSGARRKSGCSHRGEQAADEIGGEAGQGWAKYSNSIPARKMGTASRENRVTSLGVGIRNR